MLKYITLFAGLSAAVLAQDNRIDDLLAQEMEVFSVPTACLPYPTESPNPRSIENDPVSWPDYALIHSAPRLSIVCDSVDDLSVAASVHPETLRPDLQAGHQVRQLWHLQAALRGKRL